MKLRLRKTLFVSLLALAALALFSPVSTVRADGSDPMPLCRGKGCKVKPVTIEPIYLADGGPLILCPPKTKWCYHQGK